MTISKGKRATFRAAIFALIVAIIVPTAALANPPQGRGQGRGKDKLSKQEKKNAKFKNGHDARDGRWDGRGPRDRDDDRDNDDDDWDRDRGRGRRDRDRDDDDRGDRTDIRRRALSVGYNEGYRAGRDDRARGRDFDYDDHSAYRDATSGYRSSYGDRDYYRSSFREGFREGYEDGYRNRSSRGGRLGDILGDILGRP
jgi:hypothetical protein